MPPQDIARRVAARVARLPWPRILGELEENGWSRLGRLLSRGECAALSRLYADAERFRSTVDMGRHRFGRGEYRYFAHPLPPLVDALRGATYAQLAPLANRWAAALGRDVEYPPALSAYLARCHAAGQRRPTPLLLRYRAGDYNCLHQDLYGDLAFPLQVVVPLSAPGDDYTGGELIFAEQRPRSQSRATAVATEAGEGIAFTNRERPTRGTRGVYRVQMRHGLSTVTGGERYALGLIFHDAR